MGSRRQHHAGEDCGPSTLYVPIAHDPFMPVSDWIPAEQLANGLAGPRKAKNELGFHAKISRAAARAPLAVQLFLLRASSGILLECVDVTKFPPVAAAIQRRPKSFLAS
jgi:hypothetical protein